LDGDGETVGDTVGEAVGETVGDSVGDTVGDTVGDGDGLYFGSGQGPQYGVAVYQPELPPPWVIANPLPRQL
jgi:hypothetical protein